ncbi:uncharacterized protein LOC109721064 [Ananas comosus]|uniref:Uncharacterized protein LOC109721064 n=1 Tax=Ananas comosus TaxID=4615 RepID=A0A6P5G8C5_ANACO|nr:uncharacterized protein LOC109721064 [Ananas comosus]
MTNDKHDELKKAFAFFDLDTDGMITDTHEELFKGDSILCLQCNMKEFMDLSATNTVKYMTNDEHDELEKTFAFFDLHTEDLIDDKQLVNIVRFLRHSPTDDELQSSANRIVYLEFVDLSATNTVKYMTKDEHDELEKAFALFDLHTDGLIDDKQLANIVRFLRHSSIDDKLQSLANIIGGENT